MKKKFEKKIKEFSKIFLKHQNVILTVLLLIIPLFLSVYLRAFPIDLPVTDNWAENNVVNYYQNQVAQQVNAQYPNLPDARRQELVSQQFSQFMKSNSAMVEKQIAENSQYLKEQFRNKNGTYLLAIDPYHYYRHLKNQIDTGKPYDELRDNVPYSNFMTFPTGKPMYDFHLHVFLGSLLYKLFSLFGSFGIMQIFFLIPLIITSLGVIPAFFIGKKIGGKIAGFFGAAMFAMHSAVLTRTVAGFSDTDGYNVTFPLFIVWFFLEALYAKTMKSRLIYASLSALSMALFSLAWAGWWYSFAIIIATVIGYLLFVLLKETIGHKKIKLGKNPKEIAISGGVFFILSGILVSLFNGSIRVFLNFINGPLNFLLIKDVGGTKIWPNVFTTVAELNEASIGTIMNSMYGKLFFFLALVGIVLSLVPNKKGKIANYFTFGGILWYLVLVYMFSGISQLMFLVLLTVPLFVILILDIMYKVDVDARYAILLVIWFVATMFASTKGARFTLVLAPAFSIAFGLFIAFIIRKLSVLSEKEFGVSKNISIAVMFVLALFLLNTPFTQAKNIALNEVPSMNDGWYNALNKINLEASEFAVINSWWDFGHWFKAIGNRPVTFDGGTQNTPQAHWIGKVLLTSNEKEAIGILRMLDCNANGAFDLVDEITNDSLDSKLLIDKIILMEKEEATSFLLDNGFSSTDTTNIVEKTHCSNLPENYFITSYDMIGKSGVWAHFGSWNFTKSTIVNIVRRNNDNKDRSVSALVDRFGFSNEVAEDYYFQVIGNDPNNWIAPWPSYASGVSSCSVQNDLLLCQNGLAINMTTSEPFIMTQEGRKQPQSFSFVDTLGNYQMIEYDNNTIPYGAALFRNGNSYQSILMMPELTGSMFTRLYFFDGLGLEQFNKFTQENLVTGGKTVVWKVDWKGNLSVIDVEEEEEIMTDNPVVLMKTNYGDIQIELFEEEAPNTVANFLGYVEDEFYSETIFHRVIDGFMIQGGGFLADGSEKDTKDPIELEAGLDNSRGTVAMARTNNPNSATSQFFINTVDNKFLNPNPGSDGYAVFGKVISGMDVVDKISKVETSSNGPFDDWPVEDVVIEKISLK